MRSATAHKVFETDERFEVKSAGTAKTAKTILTSELLNWADSVVSNGENPSEFYPEEIQRNL